MGELESKRQTESDGENKRQREIRDVLKGRKRIKSGNIL